MLYRYDPFKTGKSQASGFIPFIPKVKPENGVQTFRIPEGYTFSPRSVLFFGLVWSLWYGKTCNDSTLQRHSVFFFCICSHEFRPPSALMDYISPEMFGMIPQILRITTQINFVIKSVSSKVLYMFSTFFDICHAVCRTYPTRQFVPWFNESQSTSRCGADDWTLEICCQSAVLNEDLPLQGEGALIDIKAKSSFGACTQWW